MHQTLYFQHKSKTLLSCLAKNSKLKKSCFVKDEFQVLYFHEKQEDFLVTYQHQF